MNWRTANSIGGRVPPNVVLADEQRGLRNSWQLANGGQAAFVTALELIQENTRFVSKSINDAQPGDLLFFDQGDDQHLMVWTGRYVGYHTGSHSNDDNGLRAVSVPELMAWRDTRWQPVRTNPNFAGVYRLRFFGALTVGWLGIARIGAQYEPSGYQPLAGDPFFLMSDKAFGSQDAAQVRLEIVSGELGIGIGGDQRRCRCGAVQGAAADGVPSAPEESASHLD